MSQRRSTCLAAAALGALLASFPSHALAGNLDSFFQSDEAAMVGGAVVAVTDGTGAIWYNPAGLGHNRRNKINVSASAFTLRLREIPGGMLTVLPGEEIAEDLSSTDVLVVPAALSFAFQVRENLSVGLGVFVSEQDFFTIDGGETVAAGGAEVTPLGRITNETVRYHAGPAIGWQPHDRLRVGVSLFFVYASRRSEGQFTLDSSAGSGLSAFAQYDANNSQLAAEGVVGMQWEPVDRWEIGLVVRLPRFEIADLSGYSEFASRGGDAMPVQFDLGERGSTSSRRMLTGPRVVVASGVVFDRGEISAEFDYTPTFDGLDLASVWNVRVGGLAHISRTLHMGAGFFTDRSAVRINSFPEFRVDFYGVAAGIDIRKLVRLSESEDSNDIIFSTTIGVRYAVGVGEASRVRFELVESGADPTLQIRHSNSTDVTFHEVSLHIGSAVEF